MPPVARSRNPVVKRQRPRWSLLAAGVAASLALAAGCGRDDAASPGSDDAANPGPDVTWATQSTGATQPTGTTDVTGATSSDPGATSAPATAVTAVTAATGATVPLAEIAIALLPVSTAQQPVDVAWRTGDATAFVVEQDGRIVTVRDGVVGPAVLDISDITSGSGEQGLLGLTFAADGTHAYINYTADNGATVVAEYAVSSDGVFDAATRRELLTIAQPYSNHNGGNVTIGGDNMLYIGMGDGGSAGDPERRALNVSNLLGKILRIDPAPSADLPYTVPADNPFVGIEGARPEIWSVGVRNPWRMSFDSATGDLWFGDVGQNAIEEVNVAWAAQGGGRGLNFGWSAFEGTQRYNDDQPADGATPPIFEYTHSDDNGCSITGGAVYRSTTIASLVGWYVFADYCSGNIYAIPATPSAATPAPAAQALTIGQQPSITAIRETPDGELWVLSASGQITSIVPG